MKHAETLAVAQEACERHFELEPSRADVAAVSGNVRLERINSTSRDYVPGGRASNGDYVMGSYVSKVMSWDKLTLNLSNNSDKIVRRLNVTVDFYNSPADATGAFNPNAHAGSLTWQLQPMISPHANYSDDLQLGQKLAPGPYAKVSIALGGMIDPTGE